MKKDRCYRDVYYQTKESKVCEFIADEKERDYCYLYGTPQKIGGVNNCELISNHPDSQDSCFNKLAIKTQNNNYCDKIKNQQIKNSRLFSSNCDLNSANEGKNACYERVIKSSYYYIELYGRFSTAEKRDECYLKHNSCDMVSDLQKKNDCFHLITVESVRQKDSRQGLSSNNG